jgi:hypothetical protein
MDGNTGRSEGATAVKAVPFPCAVLGPNRSFVDLRVGEGTTTFCAMVPGDAPLRFPDAKRYGVICSAFFFAAS